MQDQCVGVVVLAFAFDEGIEIQRLQRGAFDLLQRLGLDQLGGELLDQLADHGLGLREGIGRQRRRGDPSMEPLEHLPDLDLYADLEGLAALCAACDLVVTGSNVTAHVAGALGRLKIVRSAGIPLGALAASYILFSGFLGIANVRPAPSITLQYRPKIGRAHV